MTEDDQAALICRHGDKSRPCLGMCCAHASRNDEDMQNRLSDVSMSQSPPETLQHMDRHTPCKRRRRPTLTSSIIHIAELLHTGLSHTDILPFTNTLVFVSPVEVLTLSLQWQ